MWTLFTFSISLCKFSHPSFWHCFSDMRRGTRTFQPIFPHASVWKKAIMLLLANAGLYYKLQGLIFLFPWSFYFPHHFISLFRIPISLLYLLYIYIYTHLKQLIYFTGLCQKQWGSMCWKSSLLALLVLGRRHLQGCESDWLL